MIEIISIELPPILKMLGASIGGSIIGRRFRSKMSFRVFLCSMFSSLIMASVFALPLAKLFGNAECEPAIAALIGMFGLTICDTLDNLIKTADWDIIQNLIKTVRGG